MLTVAEDTLTQLAESHGKQVATHLFGQEINAETYAICKADLLLKGEGETMKGGMKDAKVWIGLAIFIIVCLGAGGLGAIATTPEIDGWYKTIVKPSWNPPGWIFGPVWTTLYIMMAVAAWLVWKPEGFKAATTPLTLFVAQLGLNIAWSWIFFGMHQPGLAFAEIVILWLAIVATTLMFFQRSKVAGGLMVPYLLWVSFASVLNFAIWRLNAG